MLAPKEILDHAVVLYWHSLAFAVVWQLVVLTALLRYRYFGNKPIFIESLPVAVWALQIVYSLNLFLEWGGHYKGSADTLSDAWVQAFAVIASGVLLALILTPGWLLRRNRSPSTLGHVAAAASAAAIVLNVMLLLALITAVHLLQPYDFP